MKIKNFTKLMAAIDKASHDNITAIKAVGGGWKLTGDSRKLFVPNKGTTRIYRSKYYPSPSVEMKGLRTCMIALKEIIHDCLSEYREVELMTAEDMVINWDGELWEIRFYKDTTLYCKAIIDGLGEIVVLKCDVFDSIGECVYKEIRV